MTRSLLLASMFATHSFVAAAQSPDPPTSSGAAAQPRKEPLGAAIERNLDGLAAIKEDDRQATIASAPRPDSNWTAVTVLPRGRQIRLRTSTGVDGLRTVVSVDDDELIVLDLTHPALPVPVRKRLREMTLDEPGALLAARHQTIVGNRDIRVGAGAITQSGRRLVALDEVLQAIPRHAVREVRLERTQGSKVGAIAGATAGVVGGLLLAPHWMMKPCGGSCGDEQLMLTASLVGLPVAGAVAGYQPRRSEVVVYTGPDTRP